MTDTLTAVFDGATISEDPDAPARLTGQLRRVFDAVSDGQWWTLSALVATCGGKEQAVSARLRDLRKERMGGWLVDRRLAAPGVFEYRLRKPEVDEIEGTT